MPKLETKSFAFEVKSSSEDGSEFSGLGAAFANIDGGQDIIHPNAYDKHLDFFRKNGVIRDEHEVTTGKVTDARISPKEGLLISGKISATTAGMDQRVLLKDGVVTRLSVGHYVMSRNYLDSPEEVKSFWDSIGHTPSEQDLVRSAYGARLITEARPVEVSTTFNPMNDKCQITGVKSDNGQPAGRTFDAHSLDTLAVLEEYAERAERLMVKRGADGRSLSRKHAAAFERLSGRLASLLEAIADPESKGAVPFAAAPIVDGEWDAAEATKRLKAWAGDDWSKYRKGFAWYNADKSSEVGSYHLPHHDVKDGKLVTVWKGVVAAAAVIDGARGGVESIPESDMPKVKAHLAKHYAQRGEKPPWEKAEGDGKSSSPPEVKSAPAPVVLDVYAEFLAISSRINGVGL